MSIADDGTLEPSGLEQVRAVQVITTLTAGSAGRRGSGYLVTGNAVLTAAHVVHDAVSVQVRFVTRDGHTTDLPGNSVWEDLTADIAVIKIVDYSSIDRLRTADVSPARFARVTDVVDCEALGFPRFKLRLDSASSGRDVPKRYRDSHHALGRARPWSNLLQGRLEITVEASPGGVLEGDGSPWEGMSGAAVWSGGCVIGLVSEQHHPEGPGMLAASRVDRWHQLMAPERIKELNELIGLPVTTDQLEQLPRPDSASGLSEASKLLATRVEEQWRDEWERRGLHLSSSSLAVSFRNADVGRFDHWANIRGTPPDTDPPPLELVGRVEQIALAYRSVPSGRMVVLGEAGSGKTVLAMRLVLDLLRSRVPGDRVPVIFGLGSWNPAITTLRAWLCDQLVRDYPGLAAPAANGTSLARTLVKGGRILPVLDGFDEIASDLQPTALRRLNATSLPLLMTSRPEEYAEAAKMSVLSAAAGIKLDPLRPGDFADYLRRTSQPGADDKLHSTTWEPVLAQLGGDSPSPGAKNVAEALATPLMVALARTAYRDISGNGPEELLDIGKFKSPEALQRHLLAAFIPAAYESESESDAETGRCRQRRWDPDRAAYWLGYLARHLDLLRQDGQSEIRDLAWWELGTSMSRFSRTLFIGFLAGLAFGVTTAIGNLPVDLVATSHGLGFAIVRGLVVGLLHGLAAGLLFGLVYWFASQREGFKPSPVRIRLFPGTWQPRGNVPTRFVVGVGCGLAVMLMLALIDQRVVEPLGLGDGQTSGGLMTGFVFLLGIALASGLVFGLISLLEAPVRPESVVSPAELLGMDRRNVVFHLLAWALVIGLEVGLVNGIVYGPLRGFEVGTVFGLEAAFGAGLGYGLSLTAWGQWVALCRIWLPLTGRLPWALIAFLDDAHQRGVLRQAGAVYQFRHARIQSHLSQAFQERHEPHRPGPPGSTDPRRVT
ncbi:NACHT domain-containing protein [Streptacidiphilus sp. EB103A]|uniref:NACHT domain-containing protein n=1 Tax=Streptacidiphilus sp. EB103A TaxID=3156275 RepID=UPI0035199F23